MAQQEIRNRKFHFGALPIQSCNGFPDCVVIYLELRQSPLCNMRLTFHTARVAVSANEERFEQVFLDTLNIAAP